MQSEPNAIVVIGLSAGGMTPLIELLRGISADCSAAIFIVQHIPAYAESNLAQILRKVSSLPIREAQDQLPLKSGTVYTAISDHHLLVEEGRILVTKGPRENHWRPSIDALFRSAAYAYREKVIGVILSGALNDGTSGLWRIKAFGGTSIIQDRSEAIFDGMVMSAAIHVKIDYELESNSIGPLINVLSKNMEEQHKYKIDKKHQQDLFTAFEIKVAKGEKALGEGVLKYGQPSSLSCPECHGAMTEYREEKITRYRCHTGHAHTVESLLAGINNSVEKSLWEVMRGLEETQIILKQLADDGAKRNDEGIATHCRSSAERMAVQAQCVKEMIFQLDRVNPHSLVPKR